jgi:acyl-CoA dehydrogenase
MKQAIAELGVHILGTQALQWNGVEHKEGSLLPLLVPDYLNSRAFTIFGGAAEVQLTIIARSLVGV